MGPQDRADCPSCGHSFQWGWQDGLAVEGAVDSALVLFPRPERAEIRVTDQTPVGACPRCGVDGVVFSIGGGRTVRFKGGVAVVTV